jgi:hypothetical protein
MRLIENILKFIFGWVLWVAILIYSIVINTILWNWKESFDLNMKTVITEVLGNSTWKLMIFEKSKDGI